MFKFYGTPNLGLKIICKFPSSKYGKGIHVQFPTRKLIHSNFDMWRQREIRWGCRGQFYLLIKVRMEQTITVPFEDHYQMENSISTTTGH